MSVRNVSNRGGNIIGHFPFIKTGRLVAYESTIERDFLYLANFAPEVLDIEAQPVRIEYWDDQHGGKRHYTPDYLVGMSDCDVLVECKPAEFVEREENRRKWEAARRYAADLHWDFTVVTDRQMREGQAGARLRNVKMLTQFARHAVVPSVKAAVFAALVSRAETETVDPPLAVSQLAHKIAPGDPQSAVPAILHLAFHHRLVVPLDSGPLSVGSPVWLPTYPPTPTPQPSIPLPPVSPVSSHYPFSPASLLCIPAYSDMDATQPIRLMPRSRPHLGRTDNAGHTAP